MHLVCLSVFHQFSFYNYLSHSLIVTYWKMIRPRQNCLVPRSFVLSYNITLQPFSSSLVIILVYTVMDMGSLFTTELLCSRVSSTATAAPISLRGRRLSSNGSIPWRPPLDQFHCHRCSLISLFLSKSARYR